MREDPEGKDPEVVADMMIADFKKYALPTPGGVVMFDVLKHLVKCERGRSGSGKDTVFRGEHARDPRWEAR